jgi:citrate lyase subunit beta/citryl-CoA lyase
MGVASRSDRRRQRNLHPRQAEYDHAELILEAYEWHTSSAGGSRGALMLGDDMIDAVSRKMAQVIAAKGGAAAT